MTKEKKPRVCRYCGHELTKDDSPHRRQCFGCSMRRVARWRELLDEAKRKFDEEWA
jgi:hypothetical protein